MELGSKTFTPEDQAAFARLSGDCNPMHMDAAAARRTQMGLPVTHGVHTTLWALDLACCWVPLQIESIKVNFAGPVYVGETASAVLTAHSDRQARVQVRVDGVAATTITLGLGSPAAPGPSIEAPLHRPDWPSQPVSLDLAEMSEQSGGLTFARPGAEVGGAFPHLAARVTAERVGAIVAASRLVGMVCPGLHSIFSGFSFRFVAGEAGAVLWYRTREIDPRFRMVRMAVAGGGVEGEITAFARLPPVAQPTLAEIAARTTRGAYADAVVLVVGGSRGLGEVTAKACAAGGARVIVTYASGRAEAERVAQEIRRFGGACDIVPFDARGDVAAQLAELPAVPSHLYYFATGPIALRRTRLFSADVLAEFTRFYATAFFETCETLVAGRSGAGLRAFYPSSVAVEVAPKGWTEYAMAKAAGEVLCREMNLHLPGAHVVMRRLPRILTDQTATVRRAEAAPVLEVILPIVAELQAPA